MPASSSCRRLGRQWPPCLGWSGVALNLRQGCLSADAFVRLQPGLSLCLHAEHKAGACHQQLQALGTAVVDLAGLVKGAAFDVSELLLAHTTVSKAFWCL